MPATTGLLLGQGKPCFPARVHRHQERPKCLGVQSWSLPIRSRTRRSDIMATLSMEGKAKKEGDKAKMEGEKTKMEGETTTIPGDGVRSQTTTTPEHGVLSHIITTPGDGASKEDTWVDPLLSYKKDPDIEKWKSLYSTKSADAGSFLNEHLKKDLMLYGEAAQATYDTVDLQQWSRFRDESRFCPNKLLTGDHLRTESYFAELPDAGYTAAVNLEPETKPNGSTDNTTPNEANGQTRPKTTSKEPSGETPPKEPNGKATSEEPSSETTPDEAIDVTYMHASEESDIIQSVVRNRPGQDIKHESVWIGYVAYSEKRKDILVAWRGTQEPDEWLADAKLTQVRYKPYKPEGQAVGGTTKAGLKPPFHLAKSTAAKVAFAVGAFVFAGVSTLTPFLCIWNAIAKKPETPLPDVKEDVKKDVKKDVPPSPGAVIAWVCIGLAVEILLAFPSARHLFGLVLTLPLAFIAAIPFHHVVLPELRNWVPKDWKPLPTLSEWLRTASDEDKYFPYKLYVAAVAFADVTLHFWHPSLLLEFSSFFLFKLGPLMLAAAVRAWAQAGEWEKDGKPAIYVHEGFHQIYTHPGGDDEIIIDDKGPSKGKKKVVEMASPRKVMHKRIADLMAYHDDVKTISVTGHSLGGALAVLSSFDLVKSGCNINRKTGEYVPVTCYSFEGPRVGNRAFAHEYDRLKKHGLTALRVVNQPDIVPAVPRAFYLQNVYYILGSLLKLEALCDAVDKVEKWTYELPFGPFPTCYSHVGAEITVDSRLVKWIRKMDGVNPLANVDKLGVYHNLEMVLHVLSGYNPRDAAGFGGRFTRDFALANKGGDNLNPRFGIAPNWHSTLVKTVIAAELPPVKTKHAKPTSDTELAKPPVDTEHATSPVDSADSKLPGDAEDAKPPAGPKELAAQQNESAVRKAWGDSDAYRYGPNPRPAIIEPYDVTESEPNWGVDQARVIGQGPEGKEEKGEKWVATGKNQWLEDIHAMDQAEFDKCYGLKNPVEKTEKKDASSNGAKLTH